MKRSQVALTRDPGALQVRGLERFPKVVVAVSGGADSMALLHALYEQREELGLTLTVAHFDHRLRPSSSKDRAFVEAAARALGLPFIGAICRRDPPEHGSLEDFARQQRYAFLKKAVFQARADVCVTAHTLDDQAETVLMRIIRGTGLNGLQGVLPEVSFSGLIVIRPFLGVTRQEIEGYLRKKKVRWVNDPSNRSRRFTRNSIRHDLIPFIEKYFSPDIKRALARLAATSAEEHAYIDAEATLFVTRHVIPCGTGKRIVLRPFAHLPLALRRAVLRRTLLLVKGDLHSFTLAHIDAADLLARKGKSGAFLHLPAGCVCQKKSNLALEIKCTCI